MVKLYHPDNGYFFSGDDTEINAAVARGCKIVTKPTLEPIIESKSQVKRVDIQKQRK